MRVADAHHVTRFVGKAVTRLIAVLLGGEQGTEEQHQAVRVLVVFVEGLLHQVLRVTADLAHGTAPGEDEAVLAFHPQVHLGSTHIVQAETFVKQPQQRAQCSGSVVVLGLGQQQRATPFEVTQVDVVAEHGALDAAIARHGQHHFRLWVVPAGLGVDADVGAVANRRQRLGLGEHFGIRAYTHLQVL
ncbi:hypothetical protein D3C76_423470 [compost metagenome]